LGGQPQSAFNLCDRILVYDPCQRAKANDILEEDWVRCGDPCAAAAASLLRQGDVITNIVTYKELSRFDKKILSLMADNVYDKQVIMLRRTFQALDLGKTGKLSSTDLMEGFRRNDVEFPIEMANALYDDLDKDGTGVIAYHDWLAATMGSRILRSNRATTAAFRCLNASGSGKISRSELEWAVGQEEADNVLSDLDLVDDDGCIPYDSFRMLVNQVADRRVALQQPEAVALRADNHRATLFLRASCPQVLMVDEACTSHGDVPASEGMGDRIKKALTFHPGTRPAPVARRVSWPWDRVMRRQTSR